MGSEIQSDRANAQDLRDLQDTYRKRRRAGRRRSGRIR